MTWLDMILWLLGYRMECTTTEDGSQVCWMAEPPYDVPPNVIY